MPQLKRFGVCFLFISIIIACALMSYFKYEKKNSSSFYSQINITNETSSWSQYLVEYKNDIIYINSEGSIVKKKKRGNEKVLVKHDDEIFPIGSLNIYNDDLYFLMKNNIYACSFNGENLRQIVTFDQIVSKLDAPYSDIWGFCIYDGRIYLNIDSDVFYFDPKTEEVVEMVSGVTSQPCFIKNHFYFTSRENAFAIYSTDLKTLKTEIVRGEEWNEKLENRENILRYFDLIEFQGEICYVASIGYDRRLFKMGDTELTDQEICKDNSLGLKVDYSGKYLVFVGNHKGWVFNSDFSEIYTFDTPDDFQAVQTVVEQGMIYITDEEDVAAKYYRFSK